MRNQPRRISFKDARKLYQDTARFYLVNVKQADAQTVEDVCALLDWPDKHKDLKWAARFGRSQVFASAVMDSNVMLAELNLRREVLNGKAA